MELVETQATELAKLRGDLDLETRSYTKYCLNVRHRLRELHETVASSFDEVKAWCLPFLDRGVNIEEMIDWVAGEVKIVPDTVWLLNDNFVIQAIEGVLSMLNSEGCQELSSLCRLAGSNDATVLQDVPKDAETIEETEKMRCKGVEFTVFEHNFCKNILSQPRHRIFHEIK
jgi:hypothetical protein